jgi:hypothetical protein
MVKGEKHLFYSLTSHALLRLIEYKIRERDKSKAYSNKQKDINDVLLFNKFENFVTNEKLKIQIKTELV